MQKIIIIDEANDTKWEIVKQKDELYTYVYYEYINQEWREMDRESDFAKGEIEFFFDIRISDDSKMFII